MRKPRPRPRPNPTPNPTPNPPSVQTQIENLQLVVIHRTTCEVCQAVLKEMTDSNVANSVKLVNVDTENWGIYTKDVIDFPSGSLSLPIIISQKTHKASLGYNTILDLIKKLN